MTRLFAASALALQEPPGLLPARIQMGLTLAFHIAFACLGIGVPLLLLIAEYRWLQTQRKVWRKLARSWSKVFAVLFVVGAVSGTVLSFELGLLWPEFMGRFGGVIGLLFSMEGFAFFTEAIFVGIYLYGWDRMSPRAHWLCAWPIAISGAASGWFVVTVNGWMNTPSGFTMVNDKVTEVRLLEVFFNEAAPAQVVHTLLSAYMVTGFGFAAWYAWRRLRGDEGEFSRRALALSLTMGLLATPIQLAAGHWSAQVVARSQPTKLAALEGQWETERRAPLRVGGWVFEESEETKYALELPGMLSLLAFDDIDAEVRGLKEVPKADRPPVLPVHIAFELMVSIGSALLLLSLWAGLHWLRRRELPRSRLFLWSVVASGPATLVAMEAGWMVTEIGRQPWVVQGVMRTEEAVTEAQGVGWVLAVSLGIYTVLTLSTVFALRVLSRRGA